MRLEDAVAMIAIGKLNNFSVETLVDEALKVRFQEVSGDSYNPSLPPRELMFALRSNPKALAVYENFSPNHQRHYV